MLRETCQQKAREILATAIQRYAAPHTAETTVSTVDIPTDDMKGRIIGREGRNIRAFEKATGVDVIVDDTPGIVIVTGFDNIRREIAKLALEKLIQDGRIHPTRIEEIVKETQEEMEQHIRQVGQAAAQEANVAGLHEKLLDYLGRLKFRTSYSQNVLQHSLEVAYLTGLLAEEIGLNGALGRRCGLLHDIGKAADHEMEGGHPAIGAELTKRYGESQGGRPRRARPPRRPPPRDPLHRPGRRRRRHQRQPSRRPARDPGEVRPAARGARGAGLRLPRRRAGLRDPGRPRDPRDRRQPAARATRPPPSSAATSPAPSRSS